MEVNEEKTRLEAEAEALADGEMTPEVEARLVSVWSLERPHSLAWTQRGHAVLLHTGRPDAGCKRPATAHTPSCCLLGLTHPSPLTIAHLSVG